MSPDTASTPAELKDDRPTVALVLTTYFAGSHADVAATRLIRGYEWEGRFVPPRVRVVSMYLEQDGDHQGTLPRPDIGRAVAAAAGVPLFPTVGEALGAGRPGVNVDGVVIIGEHGDYGFNELGQELYPRRRLFDAAVAAMVAADRFVPISIDKHLSYSFTDAAAMVSTAERLGIPMLAGSSVPLAWRVPTGAAWPLGAPMREAVSVSYGPVERYGHHILELLQSQVERRTGGETGVASVRALHGDAAAAAVRTEVDQQLLHDALARMELTGEAAERAKASVDELFLITYRDGLRAAGVNCKQEVRQFAFAASGDGDGAPLSFASWLERRPHRHFTYLVRQIESLMINRRSPYPVQRTLLTTGVLDAAMHSRHAGGELRETPELGIAYQPEPKVPDTGIGLPKPPGPMHAPSLAPDPNRPAVEGPEDY